MYSLIPFGRRMGDLSTLFDEFDRSFFRSEPSVPAFRTDIRDEGEHYLLQAELPGISRENIELSVENGVLTILAQQEERKETKDEGSRYVCRERRVGSFRRSFDVSGIREDEITAAYNNGVLELKLPKQTVQAPVSRRIDIQ